MRSALGPRVASDVLRLPPAAQGCVGKTDGLYKIKILRQAPVMSIGRRLRLKWKKSVPTHSLLHPQPGTAPHRHQRQAPDRLQQQ